MKTVTLKRISDDGIETRGILTVDSLKFHTLERPWKNNQHDISCIPKGEYPCEWAFMIDMKSWHYEITDVSDRDRIFFHGANEYFQLAGCIALGLSEGDLNGDGEIDIENSRVAVRQFENHLLRDPFMLVVQ